MSARKRTVRGSAAWTALIDYLGPDGGDWGPPDDLRGQATRGAYATQQAVVQFLAELRGKRSRRVYLEDGTSLPLSRVRFREPGENPAISEQEGLFGYSKASISLYGMRGRISAPGVLEFADRWADSVRFGTSPEAAFADCVWEADQWDLPEPVSTLCITEAEVEQFKPRALAIAQSVLHTRRTDRVAAEAAITAHYRVCRPHSTLPEIRWFDGPVSAVKALHELSTSCSPIRQDLQDRKLVRFNHEVTVRLDGKRSALRSALWLMAQQALGYEAFEGILNWIVEQRVQAAFGYMGLIASFDDLIWYQFLQSSGLTLDEVAATFCDLVTEVWLLFPTSGVILMVERPKRVETSEQGCMLVFRDGSEIAFAAALPPPAST
jgi:hypothetical protein